MKIVIIGAGAVGSYLAQFLARKDNEITVLDVNGERLKELAERHDLGVLQGSGTVQQQLEAAGVPEADYFLAATNIDEINILSCLMAGNLGARQRVARVRDDQLAGEARRLKLADSTVNPDRACARGIMDLLLHSGAKDYSEIVNGRIRMISLDVEKGGPLAGRSLIKLAQKFDRLDFRIVARVSEGLTSIPQGGDILEVGDTVTFAVRSSDTLKVFRMTGTLDARCRDVMILGSSTVAVMVAEGLQELGGMNVKLFTMPSENVNGNYDIAERLSRTTIYDAGRKEIDAMAQEALGDMDALLSLSEDEEKNIITGLVAKHLGVKRTITLIKQTEYMPIVKTIGLDVGINKRIIAAQEILRYVHRGQLMAQTVLPGTGALVATFSLPASSPLAGRRLAEVVLPDSTLVAGVLQKGQALVPDGETRLEGGDELTVVTLEEQLPELEKYFE